MAECIDLSAPAGLDHDGLVRLDDERRTCHAVAGLQLVAAVDCCLMPLAAGIDTDGFVRCSVLFIELGFTLAGIGARADRLDFQRLDHQRFVVEDEAELAAVDGFELVGHCLRIGKRNLYRGVGSVIAHMRAAKRRDF